MVKRKSKLIDVLMPLLVGLLLALALAIGGCTRISEGQVPCELLFCTDYSSADDAWDNGVFNELCGMDCEE